MHFTAAVRIALVLVAAAIGLGCAAGSRRTVAPAPRPDYLVRAVRYGQSLRLDVVATRVSRPERAAFDDPDRWQIAVRTDAQPLRRLVNGSTRVEREPLAVAGPWRVAVAFSAAYSLPEPVAQVQVSLRPPGHPAATITVPVSTPVASR